MEFHVLYHLLEMLHLSVVDLDGLAEWVAVAPTLRQLCRLFTSRYFTC